MSSLSATERAALLGIARGAILGHLGIAPPPALPASGVLGEPRGAFVTLHVGDELRGCVGTFKPDGSLAAAVSRMAVSAAKEDPRFRPVRAEEIAELRVAVSVLSQPHRLDDRQAVKIGTHGLLVRRGWHCGTLLPKIARDEGWDARTFLSRCCLKAGLPARAWEEPETEVEVFEADEFGEGSAS